MAVWLLRCVSIGLLFRAAQPIDKNAFKKKGCDVDLSAQDFNADFVVGGIFPTTTIEYGRYGVSYTSAVWVSSMLYAIEKINNDTNILPGIKLGYAIRDSCDHPDVAVEHSLSYMLDTDFWNPKPNKSNLACNNICVDRGSSANTLVGVIGESASSISSVISSILSTDYIPQISYASTSTSLSDKRWLYRSFMRTVPSDKFQARALVDLIKKFGWTYVSAFAVDNDYGRVGLDELRLAAKQENICFETAHYFDPRITEVKYKEQEVEHILEHLTAFREKTHIVILWSSYHKASPIIEAATLKNLTRITWLGPELWSESTYDNILEIKHEQNLIYLKLSQPLMPEFLNYMSTTFRINWRNPWFRNIVYPPFCPHDVFIAGTEKNCFFPLDLKFTGSFLDKDRRKYPQVIAAVYTLALGLNDYLNCSAKTGCSKPKQGIIDYKQLFHAILKCNFTLPGSNSYKISFDQKTAEIEEKRYDYILQRSYKKNEFGTWYGKGNLVLNNSRLDWGPEGKPDGQCSFACLPGTYRINGSSPCCWSCPKCLVNSVSSRKNQYVCKTCRRDYEVANNNRTYCIKLREVRIRMTEITGLLLLVSSIVGVLVCFFIITTLICHWDTPVVKSSSREISMIQLFSLMCLFCLPMLYFVPQMPILCMLRTLLFGFLLTTVVAIILVKTYRLIRVFNNNRFLKVSKFYQNKYQILFIYFPVLIELVAVFFWNLSFPAELKRIVNLPERLFYLTCDKKQEAIFWIILLYIFILTLIAGYVAFRARKLPENYNEAQYISLAMFTACVVWIAYVPLYFSLSPNDINIAFLVTNFVCTLSLTLILYSFKVYIILFQPKKNSSEHARKKHKEHFLASLNRDLMAKPEEQRPRLNSLPVTVHVPSVFDQPDGVLSEDERSALIIPRRASFSDLVSFEKLRKYRSHDVLNFDNLPLYQTKVKKFHSTPDFLEETPPMYHKGARKSPTHHFHPFSGYKDHSTHQEKTNPLNVFERVISSISINKLLHPGEHHKKESIRLLSSEDSVNTKL